MNSVTQQTIKARIDSGYYPSDMKITLGYIAIHQINKYLHLFECMDRDIRFDPISLIRKMIESKEINLDDIDVLVTFDLLLLLSLANVKICFNSKEYTNYYSGPASLIDFHCNRELYHLLSDGTNPAEEISNIKHTDIFVRNEIYRTWLKALKLAKNRVSINCPKSELNIFHIYSDLRKQSRKQQKH